MKLNSLNKNKRIFTNLKSVIFTRWADETTLDDVSYDVVNIIGDSVTIEQDDNTLNKIDHEFSDSMLYNTEVVGNKKLYCECIDLDNDVIANLFGWNVTDDGDAFALSDYKELYCKVEISFNSTDDIIVLPKLRMDSKAIFTSLKNDSSRGLISGTCYPAFIRIHDSEAKSNMAVIKAENANEYVVLARSYGFGIDNLLWDNSSNLLWDNGGVILFSE